MTNTMREIAALTAQIAALEGRNRDLGSQRSLIDSQIYLNRAKIVTSSNKAQKLQLVMQREMVIEEDASELRKAVDSLITYVEEDNLYQKAGATEFEELFSQLKDTLAISV